MNRPGLGGTSPTSFSSGAPGNGCAPAELSDMDKDNLRFELAKMEEEIHTLREVLLTKERDAADIRRQLGLGPLTNLKENLSKGWQEVQTSSPYLTASAVLDDINQSSVCVRTKEGLAHAGHVTSSALSNVGVAITRRLAQMRALPLPSPPRTLSHTVSVPSMRHSSTFKSFEEMVGGAKKRR
ncbi:tumor protein D54-like [Syngnathoides biaculeatus]|uniref:tumor protein D54-like n=1 Tax=Syngnathoides biaculeatus TaxID=300417 RepID=UPI002ADD6575|nr:tumor protein D54-like [Syngnathoides biaculeatus]